MGLDIRIPIGGMFIILGAMLGVYGGVTNGDPMYARSLNLNVNLMWGLVMLTFGGMMFYYGMRAKPRISNENAQDVQKQKTVTGVQKGVALIILALVVPFIMGTTAAGIAIAAGCLLTGIYAFFQKRV